MSFICNKCKTIKTEKDFYKKSHKKNGLDSNCKECVCLMKKISRQKKKVSASSRNSTRTRVLNVDSCTFDERQIIRPRNKELRLEDLIGELLWFKKQKEEVEYHMEE